MACFTWCPDARDSLWEDKKPCRVLHRESQFNFVLLWESGEVGGLVMQERGASVCPKPIKFIDISKRLEN